MKFQREFFGSVLILLALVFSHVVGSEVRAAGDEGMEALKRLAIQDAGRIKPFDTFSRETLQLVYGKETYRVKAPREAAAGAAADKSSDKVADLPSDSRERSAMEIVMTWFLAPQFWDNQEIVELRLVSLKEALNLEKTKDRFTPKELLANDRTSLVFQELMSFRETKQKLTPYFQAVERLETQLSMYQAIKTGMVFRMIPAKPVAVLAADVHAGNASIPAALPGKEVNRWLSIAEVEGPLKDQFSILAKSFIHALPGVEKLASAAEVPSLAQAVADFQKLARAENPELYPDGKDISIEVHYEELHPFRIAWLLYVTSAILLAFAWHSNKAIYVRSGWALAILAFLSHSYGFVLRMYLTGRPPVSNMYESVIWVAWGTMLFAFFFEAKQRARFILMAGAIVATFCNIIADKVPHILDSSLQPLEPVLRSNLWLTVHVLTITISYSAFFLAWAIGNMGLAYAVRGEAMNTPRVDSMAVAIYRCIQVGVVLLAAGTILGGVWADYSWGRFWGWDPKETWALIALLGYLALLHARLVGWARNLGLLIWSVIAFNLVIMAWYGVNYVLGAGLHSYGFGGGGVEYVSGFVLVDLAYVGFAYASSRAKQGKAVG